MHPLKTCLFGLVFSCSTLALFAVPELGTTLLQEEFSSASTDWKPVALVGSSAASVSYADGRARIENATAGTASGLYHSQALTGNFYAELRFDTDDALALALVRVKDGQPDLNNYTMLAVTTRNGVVHIDHYDSQNGRLNVHDPKGQVDNSRYTCRLDGTRFSVPFTGTNGRLRILREAASNSFHFYYGTRLTKFGITSEDWMELAPQYSWLPSGESYYVAVLCRNESATGARTASLDSLRIQQTPLGDIDDRDKGFAVTRRDFAWSGFNGPATVVTFGTELPTDKPLKWVVWETANNAPMWRLTDQFLLSWEFYESQDFQFKGCMEAMNDRHRHGQSVEVLEDNAVRKVVRWRGIPMNPDYLISNEGKGTQMPLLEETWTLYPDGTGTRRFIDMPKTDAPSQRRWGPEFIEAMAVGGSTVEAGDLLAAPAITFTNLSGRRNDYLPPSPDGIFDSNTWNWDDMIFNVHFKDSHPDLFLAYNQADRLPDTWCGLKIEGQMSWHSTTHRFSHWPVGREPYGSNVNPVTSDPWTRSYATHANEVTHTSLMSAGYYERGKDFSTNYRVDADGRHYRKHVMLVGVTAPSDLERSREAVQTWLYPGTVTPADSSVSFVKIDYDERLLVLEAKGTPSVVSFDLKPGARAVRNPAFRILKWTGPAHVDVRIDGVVTPSRCAVVDGSLLVWVQARIAASSKLELGVFNPVIQQAPADAAVRPNDKLVLSVLAQGTAPLSYRWYRDGMLVSTSDAPELVLNPISPVQAGSYEVEVSNTAASVRSTPVQVSVSVGAEAVPATRLINLSTRARVGLGDKVLIAGFVIKGAGAKRLLIRAAGPVLSGQGVSAYLQNPRIELYDYSTGKRILSNDDWEDAGDADEIAAVAAAVGAQPAFTPGARDSALLTTLRPNGPGYGVIVSGVGDTQGVALIELYDIDPNSASRLVNISSRAWVGRGEDTLIAGFVMQGDSPRSILVRAIGPGLSGQIGGTIPDPVLSLRNPVTGADLVVNDDWDYSGPSSLKPHFEMAGAAPLVDASRDSALIAPLAQGSYAPTVFERRNVDGLAMVEVYEVP